MIAGCGIGREATDDLDAGFDLGIGGIDDAEHGLTARHQRQRGAHALGHREFRLRRLPGAELLERGLGVFSDWHRLDVAGRDLAVAGELGEIEAGPDRHIVDLGILRCDQYDAVAEQIDAGRLVDGFLVGGVVHPVDVGGHENIRRGALLDLLGERRARGIARYDLDAGLGGVGGVDVIERVLHRSGGEYREALVLGTYGRPGRSAQQQEGQGKSGETMHGGAPACSRRDFRAQIRR